MQKKLLVLLMILGLIGIGMGAVLFGSPTPLRADPPPPTAPP
jgi:hypothetical protein